MNRRLQQLMAAENISQSQFADSLGVARASISHILAGRNKPGFDFIESLSRNYPDVNLEWIITGKGKMYKSASPKPVKTAVPDDLFASYDEDELPMNIDNTNKVNTIDLSVNNAAMTSESKQTTPPTSSSQHQEDLAPKRSAIESITKNKDTKLSNNKRNITKIIVFYDDDTYQELK